MFLISKCCVGVSCRYRHTGYFHCKAVPVLGMREDFVAVCPEMLGGLPCPREGCDVVGERVIGRRTGADFTEQYRLGAERTLAICQALGIRRAHLLKNSPSCGKDYGVTAKLLMKNGIEVKPI